VYSRSVWRVSRQPSERLPLDQDRRLDSLDPCVDSVSRRAKAGTTGFAVALRSLRRARSGRAPEEILSLQAQTPVQSSMTTTLGRLFKTARGSENRIPEPVVFPLESMYFKQVGRANIQDWWGWLLTRLLGRGISLPGDPAKESGNDSSDTSLRQ
jgi:hypothetical protein